MNCWAPIDKSGLLRARALRYLLVTILKDAGRPLTVQELIARCTEEGASFDGRPSKIISDALRWERSAGRVRHLRRGVYALGKVPRSTLQWIVQRVRQVKLWLAWCVWSRRPQNQLVDPRRSAETWNWTSQSWVPDWPGWPVSEDFEPGSDFAYG